MFKSFIGEKVEVIVSTRGDYVLEYSGILKSESPDEIELEEASCNILLNNLSKGLFGGSDYASIGNSMEKTIINKKYIISCNK